MLLASTLPESCPYSRQGEYSYPRYRPYRNATNCLAPRIRFLTFSSVTPDCRSCCSNLISASRNSLLNSLSITRSSMLGIIFLHNGSTRFHSCHEVGQNGIIQRRRLEDSTETTGSTPAAKRGRLRTQPTTFDAMLDTSDMKHCEICSHSGLQQNRLVHAKGRESRD
jgi:hypothetical protein